MKENITISNEVNNSTNSKSKTNYSLKINEIKQEKSLKNTHKDLELNNLNTTAINNVKNVSFTNIVEYLAQNKYHSLLDLDNIKEEEFIIMNFKFEENKEEAFRIYTNVKEVNIKRSIDDEKNNDTINNEINNLFIYYNNNTNDSGNSEFKYLNLMYHIKGISSDNKNNIFNNFFDALQIFFLLNYHKNSESNINESKKESHDLSIILLWVETVAVSEQIALLPLFIAAGLSTVKYILKHIELLLLKERVSYIEKEIINNDYDDYFENIFMNNNELINHLIITLVELLINNKDLEIYLNKEEGLQNTNNLNNRDNLDNENNKESRNNIEKAINILKIIGNYNLSLDYFIHIKNIITRTKNKINSDEEGNREYIRLKNIALLLLKLNYSNTSSSNKYINNNIILHHKIRNEKEKMIYGEQEINTIKTSFINDEYSSLNTEEIKLNVEKKINKLYPKSQKIILWICNLFFISVIIVFSLSYYYGYNYYNSQSISNNKFVI